VRRPYAAALPFIRQGGERKILKPANGLILDRWNASHVESGNRESIYERSYNQLFNSVFLQPERCRIFFSKLTVYIRKRETRALTGLVRKMRVGTFPEPVCSCPYANNHALLASTILIKTKFDIGSY
jgi:hypothetical protein